jgi:RHH-type transcriptional regulator, rel operon repressor / antitoxin RelB
MASCGEDVTVAARMASATLVSQGGAVAISIRLSPEDEERLEQLAANTARSKTFYVREAIHEHLDDLEERYWADRAIREWESSGRESRPAESLWTKLGA